MLSTRYIGWCPVCTRDIKVRGGLLVHHGYQRPGVGYIIGDCFGVHRPPHELSPTTAERWRDVALARLNWQEQWLSVLESTEGPEKLKFEHFDVETHRYILIWLTRAEASALAEGLPSYKAHRYSWEKVLRFAISAARSQIDFWSAEKRRMDELVSTWEPKPLRTIEQEVERKEQTRVKRETERTATRDKKISDQVVKIRARIDSAVRNKNSAALADIYSSTKLRELSGYRLSPGEARALLERDDVWGAFGLLTSSGYASGERAQKILRQMTYGLEIPTNRPGLKFDLAPMPWPPELGGGTAKTRR